MLQINPSPPAPTELTHQTKNGNLVQFILLRESGLIEDQEDLDDTWTHPSHGVELWKLFSGVFNKTQLSVLPTHLKNKGYNPNRNESMPIGRIGQTM